MHRVYLYIPSDLKPIRCQFLYTSIPAISTILTIDKTICSSRSPNETNTLERFIERISHHVLCSEFYIIFQFFLSTKWPPAIHKFWICDQKNFLRPKTKPKICIKQESNLLFVPPDYYYIYDHCSSIRTFELQFFFPFSTKTKTMLKSLSSFFLKCLNIIDNM